MSAAVGVVVIHGIGTQTRGFADGLIDLVTAGLSARGLVRSDFAFEQVFWADVLAVAERKLLSDSQTAGFLDWQPLRMFVIETLADAVAYRRGYPTEWDAYHQIHWEVYASLSRLEKKLDSPTAPLVVVAHSLGSVIISDHIWDEQKRHGFGRTPFTRCETVAGIITFGSNIPLFTLGLSQVRSIQFPPPGNSLGPRLRESARWRNYYDRDDVLGYPLRMLSDSFATTVSEDIELTAGGPLTSWNPLSHNGYLNEKRFVNALTDQLHDVHRALEQSAIDALPVELGYAVSESKLRTVSSDGPPASDAFPGRTASAT